MGIVKWYQLRQERHQIQTEIDRLILKEKNLTAELERLENDDEYIKKIARERFHMVKPGEKVSSGKEVCVVEAMKMEQSIQAPREGIVKQVHVKPLQQISIGEVLVELE